MLSEVGVLGLPDHKLRLLAASVGIAPEDLSTLTNQPKLTQTANVLQFMGAYVPVGLFRRNRSAICAECLRGRAATPAIWDLRFICVCVRHRRWLIDRCSKCDHALNWRRELLLRCRCGNDLAQGNRNDFEPPEAVLAFTKALESELSGGLPFDGEAAAKFPSFVAGRMVADSIASFQRTRRYVTLWCDREEMDLPRSTVGHCLDMAAVMIMSKVLMDWPASLHAEMQFPLISRREISSVVTPLNKLSLRFKEVVGADCVKSAYRKFCEENNISICDHRNFVYVQA